MAPPGYISATAIRGDSFIGSDPDCPPSSPRDAHDVDTDEEQSSSGDLRLAPISPGAGSDAASKELWERLSLLQLLSHDPRKTRDAP